MAKLTLPDEEVSFLNILDSASMKQRLYLLHKAGWTLSTLSESITPKRPKATLHYWFKNLPTTNTKFIQPVPLPPEKELLSRPINPLVPGTVAQELKRLHPLASKCRSRTPQSSIFRASNEELTKLATDLYLKGVSIHHIAKATGVSDRAMYRRVNKGLANV